MGEILVDAGLIKPETLRQALQNQRGTGKRLGQVLEEMDVILEEDIAAALGRQFGVRLVKGISRFNYPPAILKLVSPEEALARFIFPLKVEKKTLYLAMANPLDLDTAQEVGFRNGLQVVPCVTTPEEIKSAINRHLLAVEKKHQVKDRWWTVLIVDDQEMVQLMIEVTLKKQGYEILKANNGAEGLRLALQEKPHLILTDTLMPRMDGVEMFRNIKANRQIAHIPVIALSAKATPEEEARLLDYGYFDFMAKPINPVRLVARIKRALTQCYGDTPPQSTK
ncbi:response regulator [Geopsychrobacter electrodiphilus]|uniref:response regulator n=1 Tax=Geopsychrobacter electrodiphilus TaxID=225196 RepID=UPI00146F47B2|nr:response regulator [Geopsychrobacter electrodiphilus]